MEHWYIFSAGFASSQWLGMIFHNSLFVYVVLSCINVPHVEWIHPLMGNIVNWGCFPMWRKYAPRLPFEGRSVIERRQALFRCWGHSEIRALYFWEFRDFSRMHRWILNEPEYPQSFAFTRFAGYFKIVYRKQYTLLYTSEVIWTIQKYFVPYCFL